MEAVCPQCAMAGGRDWRLWGGHLQTMQGWFRLWRHPGPWSIRLNTGLLQGGASPECGWGAQLNPGLPSGTTAVHFISVWSVGRFHLDMRPLSEPTGLSMSPLSATQVLSLHKAPPPLPSAPFPLPDTPGKCVHVCFLGLCPHRHRCPSGPLFQLRAPPPTGRYLALVAMCLLCVQHSSTIEHFS